MNDNKNVLVLSEWTTPATGYELREEGNWRLERNYYTKGYYSIYMLNGFMFFKATKKLPIANLQEKRNGKWHTWMVDDPPHWEAMKLYARETKGRTLVAGLGLGLVMHALQDYRPNDEVVLVERQHEVIKLVAPSLRDRGAKFELIQSDWYDYEPKPDEKFDTIIIDLWVAHGSDEKKKLFPEVAHEYFTWKQRYPEAQVIIHGWYEFCDVKWLPEKSPVAEACPIPEELPFLG